ncbi:MAG: glucosaminidase domain-containing protein [Burkholderiales bacterium]|nr:glucosaminidase domain-containing protein [Burkholderiales bacterium]
MTNPYLDLVARLETRGGEATIKGPKGEDSNNLFNIKETRAGKSGYRAKDKAEGSNDAYRVYGSRDESQADMEDLLSRRYPEAYAAMQKPWSPESVTEFATGLKKRGYATDPAYVEKLVKLSGQVDGSAYTPAGKKTDLNAAVTAVVNSYVIRPVDERLAQIRREAANFDQRIIAESQPTVFESFGAAMSGNTDQQFGRAIRDTLFGPKYPAEQGFVPDVNLIPDNADANLVQDFKAAKSRAEVDAILEEHRDEVARGRAIMGNGTGTGIALSFLAEVPTLSNLLPSMAAAKAARLAGYANSAQMLAEGRKGAMVGAAVAENVASGTVVEALRQGVTGDYSLQDLGLAMAADVTFGLGQSALAARSGERTLMAVAQERELAKYTAYLQDAEEALGPSATPDELRKWADTKYTQDIVDMARQADTHDLPKERRLLDVVDEADDKPVEAQAMRIPEDDATKFSSPTNAARVARDMTGDDRFNQMADLGIFTKTDDFAERKAQFDALNATPGTHLAAGTTSPVFKRYAAVVESLRKQLLPEVSIHLTDGKTGIGDDIGLHGVLKPGMSMIAVKPGAGVRAVAHEFAHAVFAHRLAKASPENRKAMVEAWQQWQKTVGQQGESQTSMLARSPVAAEADKSGNAAYRPALMGEWDKSLAEVFQGSFKTKSELYKFLDYFANFDEFSAEQGVKYMEAIVAKEIKSDLKLPTQLLEFFKYILSAALDVFKAAKKEGLIAPATPFKQFFDDVLAGNKASKLPPLQVEASDLQPMAVPTKAQAQSVSAIQTDPDIARFGLSTLPVATDADRATVKQMLELHKRAEAWAAKNPIDPAKVQNLADNNVFNVASIGLIMLKSESPLVRMIASELMEDASGVQNSRRATAAIAKYLTNNEIMGNAINDYQNAYDLWKKPRAGAGLYDDMVRGENKAEFDKLVASEIEARRTAKQPVTTDANVKAAADVMEAAYTRGAAAQRKAKTLGWASLPESSVGYMPHKMSPRAVMMLTNEQQQVLHSALTDQFITIEGWDASFADELSSKYMKRVRDRAAGDYSSTVGGNTTGAADIVQDALIAMNLSAAEIKAHMKNYTKGAANFTKKRIELDLNRVYETSTGPFRLMDVFETNQIELLRGQAGRVSGDVALAKYGVYGKPGLQLLRDAMRFGEDGKKASVRDLESFDQMAAEFHNEPFGTQGGKFMERAMAANTLVRMGGIVFNQLAETLNGVFHVGALRTAESVAAVPRLRSEIKALARGEAVDNPIIGSIELVGGSEFGTDGYKFVMPFDSPDHAYPTYGRDTLTLTDRLLRGGNHLQSKLSGWRTIHSAQQRGMAEQIVHKMMRYVRDGGDDVALRDFGITPEVQAYLRENLSKIATFDGDRLVRFEADKLPDGPLRDEVIQAVWRGTAQIIQGTFIGERGKWAHDGFLKLLTQFRTFSITSMEKQWGRQRNQRGGYAAFGMAIGAMSMAWPIYAARVYANSIGRPDQEEYIEERLTPQNVARASLNYIAMSGLAGDFIDALTAVAPDSVKEATGFNPMGSTGKEADLIGNYVLPSAGLANDTFKWLQSPLEAQDAAKIMPLSRLPYLVPLMNTTKD